MICSVAKYREMENPDEDNLISDCEFRAHQLLSDPENDVAEDLLAAALYRLAKREAEIEYLKALAIRLFDQIEELKASVSRRTEDSPPCGGRD